MKQSKETLYEFSQEQFSLKDELFERDYSVSFSPILPLVKQRKGSIKKVETGFIEIYTSKHEVLLEQYALICGKKQGRFLLFFSTGQVASERWYIEDVLWGKAIDYFPNGKKKVSFGYKDGKLHGPFLMWNELGVSLLQGYYKAGIAEGAFQVKNGEGLLIRTAHFKNGKRDGIDAGFADDGCLLFLDKWAMGEKKKSSFNDILERYLFGTS
jgi:antitoxin component YwqK of YwqJK toxin-antitoxin module